MPYSIRSKILLFIFFKISLGFSQQNSSEKPELIQIIHADYATTNAKYPGKQLLSGNVEIEHNQAILYCNKAIVDKQENTAIAVGNVRLIQGDTLEMRSGYLSYDGNKSFAKAIDNVFLRDPKMNLKTDTLMFDRQKQIAFYTSGGVIRDSVNELKSKIGKYFLQEKKYSFINNVHINNPDYQLDSYHLDYFTDSGVSNFYGPTKIYNDHSYIYSEKGHYDSKNQISWFVKNAFIKDRHTTIRGDSLYYEQKNSYATANKNVILHDSINKIWIFSNYGQYWGKKDSVEVTRKPLIISINEQDSLYIRARKFIATGKKNNRKLWGYDKVRFFSKDFSGKADSLYRNDSLRILKLMKNPVIWNGNSQITGQLIKIKNDSLNHADSLYIPKNVFIIQKDSAGFNQIKGKKLLGKFKKNKIHKIDILGNTEVIYYLRDENQNLTGIEKNKSSKIQISFDDQSEIETVRLNEKVDGTVYPPEKLKEKQFKGFNWRGKEIIRNKEDILENFVPVFEARTKQKKTFLPEDESSEK